MIWAEIIREECTISSWSLCHDHESALYHFGTAQAECNVHLCRYPRKNTEETGNAWSHKMESFLNGMNSMRRGLNTKPHGKIAGGFRTDRGLQMYCFIMSFIETTKRKKENILYSGASLMNGTLVNT